MKSILKLLLLTLLFLSFTDFVKAQDEYLIDTSSQAVFIPPNQSLLRNIKYTYDDENRLILAQNESTRITYVYEGNKTTKTHIYNLGNSILSQVATYVDDDGREIRIEKIEDEIIIQYDSIVYKNQGLLKMVYLQALEGENYFTVRTTTETYNSSNQLLLLEYRIYDFDGVQLYLESSELIYNQNQQLERRVDFNDYALIGNKHDTTFYNYQNEQLKFMEKRAHNGAFFQNAHLIEYDYSGDTVMFDTSTKFSNINNLYSIVQSTVNVPSSNLFYPLEYGLLYSYIDQGANSFVSSKIVNSFQYSMNLDSVFVHLKTDFFDIAGNVAQLTAQKEIWLKNEFFTQLEETIENKLAIYPNPSAPSSRVEIKTKAAISEYLLFDNVGRLMVRKNLSHKENLFVISPQIAGVYRIVFLSKEGKFMGTKTLLVH